MRSTMRSFVCGSMGTMRSTMMRHNEEFCVWKYGHNEEHNDERRTKRENGKNTKAQ